MNGPLHEAFRRWINSEGQEEDERAERALADLFALLPPPSGPSRGFSARVMASLPGLSGARARPVMAWGWRLVLATALALTGFATILTPSVLSAASWFLSPHLLVSAGAGLAGSLARAFIEAIAVGKAWIDIVTVLWRLISIPSLWSAWLVAVVTSLAAFRWLLDQPSKRSSGHASPQ